MTVHRKAISGITVKDADQGTVEAVFSRLKVIDHDGDVTLPGAFRDGQEVRISAYNHASWGPGMLPVGKGTIREQGDEAIFSGQFFMDTQAGKDTFATVKQLGSLGEWSYGFDIDEAEEGTWDGQNVRILRALTVHEVSPVMLGAGIGTRTLAAKGADKPDELKAVLGALLETHGPVAIAEAVANTDMKLAAQLDFADATVRRATERLADVVTLRAEQGKNLSGSSASKAQLIIDTFEPRIKALRDVLTSADADNGDDSLTEDEAAAIEAELTMISATSTP